MKKVACIFFIITIIASSIFADKSRFYEDGKVIDTMYVDSPEGLRARRDPSLQAVKICVVPHRLPVKVLAIGKEEKIDGITAPWVEIVLPHCEWIGDQPRYGWVFGGYLKKEQPKFNVPKNAMELWQYLTSVEKFDEYENNRNHYYIFSFRKDGRFWHGKDGSGIGEGGDWKAVSKDTVKFNTSYVMEYEEDYSWELKFVFENDGSFHYAARDVENYCYPSFEQDNPYIYSTTSKGNYITKYDNIESWSPYNRPIEECVMELIKWGISAKGTKFEQQYHAYWDPIMREHQKKADEMK